MHYLDYISLYFNNIIGSMCSHIVQGVEGSGKSVFMRALWPRLNIPKVLVYYHPALVAAAKASASKPPEFWHDVGLVLLAKQIADGLGSVSAALRLHCPWIFTGILNANEMRRIVLYQTETHRHLVNGIDAASAELQRNGQVLWVGFDGFDAEPELAIGLLHVLGGYWRRWGRHIRVVVTARDETVRASISKGGADYSKLINASTRLQWPAHHLWILLSMYLLNDPSLAGRKLTTMQLVETPEGTRCKKNPTLAQVLLMLRRSGRVLSRAEAQLLKRIDSGKVTGTPAMVLRVLNGGT